MSVAWEGLSLMHREDLLDFFDCLFEWCHLAASMGTTVGGVVSLIAWATASLALRRSVCLGWGPKTSKEKSLAGSPLVGGAGLGSVKVSCPTT
jgi:hypothetical protein